MVLVVMIVVILKMQLLGAVFQVSLLLTKCHLICMYHVHIPGNISLLVLLVFYTHEYYNLVYIVCDKIGTYVIKFKRRCLPL